MGNWEYGLGFRFLGAFGLDVGTMIDDPLTFLHGL